MDDLLDRAGAAFLAGDATLARGAYRVLLAEAYRDWVDALAGAGRATGRDFVTEPNDQVCQARERTESCRPTAGPRRTAHRCPEIRP